MPDPASTADQYAIDFTLRGTISLTINGESHIPSNNIPNNTKTEYAVYCTTIVLPAVRRTMYGLVCCTYEIHFSTRRTNLVSFAR